MRGPLILLLLAGTGCDQVFALESPPACGPKLAPGLDEDGDMTANADDACPLVAFEAPDDEDGDGRPDACDLCPLDSGDPGEDHDCDGLGRACDPDDTTPHERTFYGFGSLRGFRFGAADDGIVADGQVQMMMTPSNTRSTLRMDDPATRVASYVAVGRLWEIQAVYHQISIEITDSAERIYEISIEWLANGQLSLVLDQAGAVEILRRSLGTIAGPDLRFELRADVTADGISAAARIGDTVGTLEAGAAMAPVADGAVRYAFVIVRTSPTGTPPTHAALDYFSYTGVLPPQN